MHFRTRGNTLQFARELPQRGQEVDIQSMPGAGTANMVTGEINEFVKGSLTEEETAEIRAYLDRSKGAFSKRQELELATLADRIKEIAQSLRLADDEVVSTYGDGIMQAMGMLRQALTRRIPQGES